jgi:hypothetical protein
MASISGGQQEALKLKIAESKARISDLEAKARSKSRVPEAELDPRIASRIHRETIGGVVLLACIALAAFILFFVF